MNITLLIGSPKAHGSTSESLGDYVTAQLEGAQVSKHHAHQVIRTEKYQEAFLSDLAAADVLLVSFPLYVDTLPYVLQQVFEMIASDNIGLIHGQRLVCINNCGFPESHHTELALAVCEQFAIEVGLTWQGGVGMGAGGVIDGQPLSEISGRTTQLRKGLDALAAAIRDAHPITDDIAQQVGKPMIPASLYRLAGTLGWHIQGRSNGVMSQLRQRPYEN